MATKETGLTPIKIGIVLLTLAAAGIHFSLLFPDLLFILNGLGYLSLLAALFLPLPIVKDRRNLVKIGMIFYTLLTIVLYFVMNDTYDTLGLTTKAIEVTLIILLLIYKPEQ